MMSSKSAFPAHHVSCLWQVQTAWHWMVSCYTDVSEVTRSYVHWFITGKICLAWIAFQALPIRNILFFLQFFKKREQFYFIHFFYLWSALRGMCLFSVFIKVYLAVENHGKESLTYFFYQAVNQECFLLYHSVLLWHFIRFIFTFVFTTHCFCWILKKEISLSLQPQL